jgi:hypothetical protein
MLSISRSQVVLHPGYLLACYPHVVVAHLLAVVDYTTDLHPPLALAYFLRVTYSYSPVPEPLPQVYSLVYCPVPPDQALAMEDLKTAILGLRIAIRELFAQEVVALEVAEVEGVGRQEVVSGRLVSPFFVVSL